MVAVTVGVALKVAVGVGVAPVVAVHTNAHPVNSCGFLPVEKSPNAPMKGIFPKDLVGWHATSMLQVWPPPNELPQVLPSLSKGGVGTGPSTVYDTVDFERFLIVNTSVGLVVPTVTLPKL